MAAFQGWRRWVCGAAVLAGSLSSGTAVLLAQVVPGTGTLVNTDDLENPNWAYAHNGPKSSKEEDEQIRYPLGAANNNKWFESPKRGSPDVVKRVDTPPGGLAGSTGALYLRTRDSGIPGHPGGKQAQDDFILAAKPLAIGSQPNYTVRVFLPEWSQWEQRNGVTFGVRAGMQGPMTKDKEVSFGRRLFKGKRTEKVTEMEPYYPGFFVQFNPKSMPGNKEGDHALILIRSDGLGHEVPGPKITQTGWWTFGMSVSPDARCHYFASPGVDELTAQDHIYSSLPYGIRGEVFNTVFFNVCSADNGQTWSTPWIIDDPKVYYVDPRNPAKGPIAQQPAPLKTAANPNPVTTPAAPQTVAPQAPIAPMAPAVPVATTPAPATAAAPVPMAPAALPAVVTPPPAAAAVAPAIAQPQARVVPQAVPATVQPAVPAGQPRQAAQPQMRAAQVPVPARVPATAQPQARVAQVPAAAPAQVKPAVIPQPKPAAILQVPAAQAASIPMTTAAPQPAAGRPAPVPMTAQVPQPVAAPASARPLLVAPQPAVAAAPAPVAKAPVAQAPTEAAAPATTKAIPMPQAPLLVPGTPAPAAIPAPALPSIPMTAQLPAEIAPKGAPATVSPKTPNPKVISADDFFAPPPRAPLAPVNPASRPPAPPAID